MKKNILQVSCGGLGHGGVSTVIFSIVENLYDRYNFDCVVFKKKCDRESLFEKYGKLYRINCYNTGKRSILENVTRPFILFLGIYKICKKKKYDVIHVHNGNDEGFCLFAAKCAGVKFRIAHAHNTTSPRDKKLLNKIKNKLNAFLINKYATHKVGCSNLACKDFFGASDYKVIFNSINLEKYKCSMKVANSNEYSFIHVGRFTYQKNQEFVVKVFSAILKELGNATLKLIGFGPDEEKLKKLVEELKLEKSIKFLPGDKTDIVKEYEKSNYMIFPSVFEGFGIVLIEAQAFGIKCFVAKETIQKETNVGLLTYISLKKSPEEWAKIILDYIKNMKEIDYTKITGNLMKFDVKNISKQYNKLYDGGL